MFSDEKDKTASAREDLNLTPHNLTKNAIKKTANENTDLNKADKNTLLENDTSTINELISLVNNENQIELKDLN
jgi:hypothetical protein